VPRSYNRTHLYLRPAANSSRVVVRRGETEGPDGKRARTTAPAYDRLPADGKLPAVRTFVGKRLVPVLFRPAAAGVGLDVATLWPPARVRSLSYHRRTKLPDLLVDPGLVRHAGDWHHDDCLRQIETEAVKCRTHRIDRTKPTASGDWPLLTAKSPRFPSYWVGSRFPLRHL